MADIVFVLAERQNTFFVEIVDAIRDELRRAGIESSVAHGAFPDLTDDRVYVLVPPHEWFALRGRADPPTRAQLRRTVGICAEQPGTSFFSDDLVLGRELGALLDVNAAAIRAFKVHGIPARHFPLGWTPTWSHEDLSAPEPSPSVAKRDIDVGHMGIFSERRARIFAANAWHLSRWRCRLSLSDDDGPNFASKANYATGTDKWELLRRMRVLLNVHVADRPYFEWQRIVQAVANGALVVSEHSTDHAPMEIGRHFVSGRPESLGLLLAASLEDEGARRAMAREAWLFLKHEQPFSASMEVLVEAIDEVACHPAGGPSEPVEPELLSPKPDGKPALDLDDLGRPVAFPSISGDPDVGAIRGALKDMRIEMLGLRRQLAALREEARPGGGGVCGLEIVADSPAWRATTPRISVLTALYNYEDHIGPALDSCARSLFGDLEHVIVDDGSTDRSIAAVRVWMARHPDVPVRLLRHPVNRGLGSARNAALDFARGEYAFILDADNVLFRTGLGKLVHVLDDNPEALFAYGVLEMFSGKGSIGLRSYYPWRPGRLRQGNYIDAMALWRTRVLRRLGGYTTDPRLHGWEDYDLWCRVAERGGHGIGIPEPVARYRVTRHSMLSVTNISASTAVSVLVERYPKLMGTVIPPY